MLIISSIWSNPLDQIISTQNKVLAKITVKFIALDLMIYFNSSKSSETSVTVVSFIWKRENSPDFLCMNAMHTLVFSHFIASKPGILQPLPLKLNFVPKFERSHVSECWNVLNRSPSFNSMVITLDIIEYIPSPDPSCSLLMSGTNTFFYSMISSHTLSL